MNSSTFLWQVFCCSQVFVSPPLSAEMLPIQWILIWIYNEKALVIQFLDGEQIRGCVKVCWWKEDSPKKRCPTTVVNRRRVWRVSRSALIAEKDLAPLVHWLCFHFSASFLRPRFSFLSFSPHSPTTCSDSLCILFWQARFLSSKALLFVPIQCRGH